MQKAGMFRSVSASPKSSPSGYEAFILRKSTGISLVVSLALFGALAQILNPLINGHFHGLGPVVTSESGLKRYVWAAPNIVGVIFSACFSAAIATLDFALKRIEPYRQLGKGHATADQSLLLDYLSTSQVFVWRRAWQNRHWTVVLSTAACLLSLALSPIASTLFVISPSSVVQLIPITLTQSPGLPPGWDALVPSYAATNILASVFLVNGTLPAYISPEFAFPSFTAPYEGNENATLSGVIPGIRSSANCEDTDIEFSEISRNAYFRFNATIKGKQSGKIIPNILYGPSGYPASGRTMFNASVAPLNGQSDPRFQTFIYQIFTPLTEDSNQATTVGPPNMSVTVCNPTVQALAASVNLQKATRIISFAEPEPDDHKPPENLDFLNVTNNAGFNGYSFNTSIYGPIVEMRREATMFALTSVMYQAAADYPGGLHQAYADNAHHNLTKTIYQNYLSILASKNYFNDTAPPYPRLIMSSTSAQNMLFVSTLPAILVSVVLFLLAALVLAALLMHWRTFRAVGQLRADPGSMAGTGMTLVGGDVARLLEDPDTTRREMKAALRRYRWCLVDGKVCAEGEGKWEGKVGSERVGEGGKGKIM